MYQELLGMRHDEVRAEIAWLEREALSLLTADAVPDSSLGPGKEDMHLMSSGAFTNKQALIRSVKPGEDLLL
jgi:hypothetical protein